MRIKQFRPDGEQLPTSLWFTADGYPVQYEVIDNMTVIYHFIFHTTSPIMEIMDAANKVFCRQPMKYGNPRYKVSKIEELESENPYVERIFRVDFEFDE